MKDFTVAQFKAACERRGFKQEPFGYWSLPLDGGGSLSVHIPKGGWNRRAQLAYMVRRQCQAGATVYSEAAGTEKQA